MTTSSDVIQSTVLHVESRLAHHKKLLEEKPPGQYQLEENVILADGGRLLHIQTNEGSIYHLVNGSRWLFLEKGPHYKSLYVCDLDDQGQPFLNTNIVCL